MFELPVTVYEIFTFNLSKWSVFESMTFNKYMMSYNVAEYVLGWLLMACKMTQKNIYGRFISNCFCGPQISHSNGWTHTHTHIHTHTHTHTHTNGHTPTNAIDRNATRFISIRSTLDISWRLV